MSKSKAEASLRKRNQLFDRLNNFTEFVNNFDNNKNVFNLTARLNSIERLLDEFYEINSEIDSDDTKFNEFQNEFYESVGKAQQIIHTQKEASSLTPQNTNVTNVILPKQHLPSFNGDFSRWNEFQDSFNSLIRNNTSLNNVQKISYLKGCLKEGALDLISSIPNTNENFDVAWNLLVNNYNNRRRILLNHTKSIVDLRPIQKESYAQLGTLINTIQRNLSCLNSLATPDEIFNVLLTLIVINKLDSNLALEWELKMNSHSIDSIPTIDELIHFLKIKYNSLESYYASKPSNDNKPKIKTYSHLTTGVQCSVCNGNHYIFSCSDFIKLSIHDRISKVKQLNLCLNCLHKGHNVNQCKSSHNCKTCNKRHNTLLHIPIKRSQSNDVQSNNSHNSKTVAQIHSNPTTQCNFGNSNSFKHSNALLSTVIIQVSDIHGNFHNVRALLDSGSLTNYITQSLVNKLRLKQIKTNISVAGISELSCSLNSETNIFIKSKFSDYSTNASCLISNSVTGNIPQVSFAKSHFSLPKNIQLSDPDFNKSQEIDILLGSSIFWDCLNNSKISLGIGKPVLHDTKFGWVIGGAFDLNTLNISKTHSFFTATSLHDDVHKFWQIDEFLSTEKHLTEDEQYCEQHFLTNITNDESGRYIVALPFKPTIKNLQNNYNNALTRFLSLENKFKKQPQYHSDYNKFISEYEELGHMSKFSFDPNHNHSNSHYFLPHHGVFKNSSTTTKLRVVFDGSCKSDSTISLNDTLFVGPTLQSDLFSILSRFRLHQYVLTADIEKMYRQVLVRESDRNFQCIIYRQSPNRDLQYYKLNTVTYGTSSAPYLATRCLIHLADKITNTYPRESIIIKDDFYVDDLITGTNNINELKSLKLNLENILKSSGFILRKFRSNLNNLSDLNSQLALDGETHILGITWCPEKDIICYKTADIKTENNHITKRTILSKTAKLFDPLGLIAPIIVMPKILIQSLWQLKLGWDDPIPASLSEKWLQFEYELDAIHHLEIKRLVISNTYKFTELHVFADASEKAYGACAYLRVIDSHNNIHVSLISAKSRVAPIRKTTLPRLELNAAVIASQLSVKLKSILKLNFQKIVLWSDSTIVLSWLNKSPSTWHTYVANRVAEIQRLTNPSDWFYIPTEENPADIVSRGCNPVSLVNSTLWWTGPTFFNSNFNYKPFKNTLINDIPELKTIVLTTRPSSDLSLFSKFSNLRTLVHVAAYCYRWLDNTKNKTNRSTGIINPIEFNITLNRLIKIIQFSSFQTEITCLQKGKSVSSNSNIFQLNPFLNNDGLLCVGGRLQHSNLTFKQKHQILLPNHKLTEMIIRYEHIRTLHSGPQSLLNSIRQNYWPLRAKHLIRKICHSCIQCFKAKPKNFYPLMGNLPESRVNPSPAFYNSGVDYAGPFEIKTDSKRKYTIHKCYICLFICMATRAIHLELVTDLTTDCFLSALRRFISRRGIPKAITSDNGTNFVGAANKLKDLQLYFNNNSNSLISGAADLGIVWKFIPPRAPNFGGLWEAGVKSVKNHLKRVISSHILNFESFYTVLTQIEAVLNSRPISPISNSPNDLNPLTPAHFLIGRNLTTLPDEDVTDIPINRLSKYKLLQSIVQSFWKRWSREYLHTLQQRSRWNKQNNNVKIGDLALIIEENLPPMSWRLGRIVKLHSGDDKIVRVVTLKVQGGETKRSVSKLCVLPLDSETN